MCFYKKCLLLFVLVFVPALGVPGVHKAHLSSGWYSSLDYAPLAQKHFSAVIDSGQVRAIIVPHAGQRYSGLCAASVYQYIPQAKRIIILAPSHRHAFSGIALPNYDTYQMPLGPIPVDVAAIEQLKKSGLFKVVPQAHRPEHAVEVQLPFLQKRLSTFSIVPLVVGSLNPAEYDRVAQTLAGIIDNETLIVVSSDFVHYGVDHGYTPFTKNILANIRRVDSQAIEAITNKSFTRFNEVLTRTKATICGRSAIKILLKLIEKGTLGTINARLLSYYTSAQLTPNGPIDIEKLFSFIPDRAVSNSVSYAGLLFTQETPPPHNLNAHLTSYEKRALLTLARDVIANELADKNRLSEQLLYPIFSPGVKQIAGAFVSLHKTNGLLRGCIGRIISHDMLYKTVAAMAKSAAFQDHRFTPLTSPELSGIKLDITVLSPPRRVASYNDITLGTHGIILKKAAAKAVFLPQVPGQFNWDLVATLSALASKAGLSKDAWKQGCEFEVFEGLVIK